MIQGLATVPHTGFRTSAIRSGHGLEMATQPVTWRLSCRHFPFVVSAEFAMQEMFVPKT